jgi:hypothetical protein
MPITADPVRQNWSDVNSKTIQNGLSPFFHPAMGRIPVQLNRSPSLDQAAGLFRVRFGQGRPHAADRSTNSIGTLLPIALCGRSSLYNKA